MIYHIVSFFWKLLSQIIWLKNFVGTKPPHRPPYVQSVTATIELLFSGFPKKYRPYIGGAFHFIPALVIIIVLAVTNNSTSVRLVDWIFLGLAASWTAVGPFLIWYYDIVTLPKLFEKARDQLKHETDVALLHKIIHGSYKISKLGYVVSASYVVLITWLAITYEPIISRFGLNHSRKDIWILFILGIAITSYMTSTGFRFLFRSLYIIRNISNLQLNIRLHHSDGYLGLSFLEKFASSTNWMFVSGFLIIPSMSIDIEDFRFSNIRLWVSICIVSIAAFMFGLSTFIIHRKLKFERENLLRLYGRPLNALEESFREKYDSKLFSKLDSYRKLFEDSLKVRKWPLSMEIVLPFVFRFVALPLMIAVASSQIRSNAVSSEVPQPFGEIQKK